MATPHDIAQARIAELTKQLTDKEYQLQKAKAVHDQYKIEKQQSQDLLFACLHTLGPKISIQIEHFHEYFRDAQFDGELFMSDEGKYVVNLQFYQEGIEEHWRRKLSLGNEFSYNSRVRAFHEALAQEATPEEAYTIAINNYP